MKYTALLLSCSLCFSPLALATEDNDSFLDSVTDEETTLDDEQTSLIMPRGYMPWEGQNLVTDEFTKTLTLSRAIAPMPHSIPINTHWGVLTPNEVEEIVFYLNGSPKKLSSYVQFSGRDSNKTSIKYSDYFQSFSKLSYISGFENVYFGGIDIKKEDPKYSLDYSHFFSNALALKFLDISKLNINTSSNPAKGSKAQISLADYNFTGFLQNVPNLEYLVLSDASSSPIPSYGEVTWDTEHNLYKTFAWSGNGAAKITDALDFNNGRVAKLKEITYNSNKTPLNVPSRGQYSGLNLDNSKKWVRMTKPFMYGGEPYKDKDGNYQFLTASELQGGKANQSTGHTTGGMAQTWHIDIWNLEQGGTFNPYTPPESEKPPEPETAPPVNTDEGMVYYPFQNGVYQKVLNGDGVSGDGLRNLYLNWISSFDFKEIKTTTQGGSYTVYPNTLTLEQGEIETEPFIQITDQRERLGNTVLPWKVSVKADPIVGKDKETILKGFSLKFGSVEVLTDGLKTYVDLDELAFDKNPVVMFDSSRLDTLTEGVTTLKFNTNQQGMQLIIPKQDKIIEDRYESVLTWILDVSP